MDDKKEETGDKGCYTVPSEGVEEITVDSLQWKSDFVRNWWVKLNIERGTGGIWRGVV